MRVLLMSRGEDFDVAQPPPANAEDLIADLELDTLLDAMSGGDRFLRVIAQIGLLDSLQDPDAIAYRQAALRDCLANGEVVRELYSVALEAIQSERRHWAPLQASPQSLLSRSHAILLEFVEALARLRGIGIEHRGAFSSDAFTRLFGMLDDELDDQYLQTVRDQMAVLGPNRGSLSAVRLGAGNQGVDYVLLEPEPETWLERVSPFHRRGYSFEIAERDHSGARALSELADRALNPAANALAQSVEHIVAFLQALLRELAFYLGALNLHERLGELGTPTCFPTPAAAESMALTARELYDVPLALALQAAPVGNDLDADGRPLIVITGANRGGKSTLLRSLGIAQLMMQCGLFVGAERFGASIRAGIFTHHRREEDASMTSGKLVEELSRMSSVVDSMASTSVLLCNESFASTNEREGSEIGRQVVTAMVESGLRVVFVTHLYDLAHRLETAEGDRALFLRADPAGVGEQSFKLRPGEPQPSSHAIDVYREVFGERRR